MRWLSRWAVRNRKSPSDEAEYWFPIGAGNLVGDQWTAQAMSNGTERASNIAWLDGFFSGLSLAERHRFFASDDDLNFAVEWMDQRLLANHEEKVSHAAAQLAAQLLDPTRTNPW